MYMNTSKHQAKAVGDKQTLFDQSGFKIAKQTYQRTGFDGQILPDHDYLTLKRKQVFALLCKSVNPETGLSEYLVLNNFRPATMGRNKDGVIIESLAGTVEPSEDIKAAVIREFYEETEGLELDQKSLQEHFGSYSSPGFCDEYVHFFTAEVRVVDEQASDVAGKGDDEAESVQRKFIPLAELVSLLRRGEITDLKLQTLILLEVVQRCELFKGI